MELSKAILQRRSIRKYLDTPVEQDLIASIFAQAQESPSNCNTQPWRVSVVSGKVRDDIEKRMLEEIMSGKQPKPVFKPGDKDLDGEFRQRQIDCAISLYDSVGVKFEEKDKRQQLMLRNWQFFGAPHGAFFSMPKTMREVNAVDIGIYLQTVMLLMTANGIGCCAQGALAMYPDAAYELAGVPKDHGILFGLSFGYADDGDPLNKYNVGRAELDDSVKFYS
ncbi:MAG: nitroreductase [Acidiferrobacterales bacterium]|nr:nitroreductase [Acidiferrobacterales bacterium]